MSSTRKHFLNHYNTIGGRNKSKRLTRSTVGSTVDIPIVLDSDSDSGDNNKNFSSDKNSNSIKSVSPIIKSKTLQENDELEQVLTNSRILNAEKRKLLNITTRNKITKNKIKIKEKPLKTVKKLIPLSINSSQNNESLNKENQQSTFKKFPIDDSSLSSVKNSSIVSSSPSSSSSLSNSTTSSIVVKKAINENSVTLTPSTSLNSNSNSNSIPSSNQKSITSVSAINNKENNNPSENTNIFNKNINTNSVAHVTEKNKKLDNNDDKINKKGKEIMKKENLDNLMTFDPKTQKSYRNTYSVCCISCKRKNRSEYCNRQLPCDICVGKKLKNCAYPPDAKIVIPARFVKKTKFKSSKYNLNYSSISNKQGNNLTKNNLSKQITQPSFKIDSIANRVNSVNSENNNRINRFSKLSGKFKFQKSSNNRRIKGIDNSKRTDKNSNDDDDETDDFVSDSDDYGGSEEDNYSDDKDDDSDDDGDNAGNYDDDDDDDNDDDYNDERNYRHQRPRRLNNRKNIQTGQDNFVKAQRILKELEFEKRDINDIYVPNTRRKRVATKENYYIPSDVEEENDSLGNNGYAEAEARNENLILSEDEQDRRLLRGDIDIDYIKTLRNELEKRKYNSSDDSLSSDDD